VQLTPDIKQLGVHLRGSGMSGPVKSRHCWNMSLRGQDGETKSWREAGKLEEKEPDKVA